MENQEINCENCVYYDTDRKDQPCCSCVEYSDWVRSDTNDRQRQADRVIKKKRNIV